MTDNTQPRERGMKETVGPENLAKFVKMHNSQRAAGEQIGVVGSTISTWLSTGKVPVAVDLAVQHLMGSQVIAVRVRCSDMDQAIKLMGMLDLMGLDYEQERR